MTHGTKAVLLGCAMALVASGGVLGQINGSAQATIPMGTSSGGMATALSNNWGGGLICSGETSSITGEASIISVTAPGAKNRVAFDLEALAGTTAVAHDVSVSITATPTNRDYFAYVCTVQVDGQAPINLQPGETYVVGDGNEVRIYTVHTVRAGAVPTLGTWALIAMGLGVFGIGVAMIWRIV